MTSQTKGKIKGWLLTLAALLPAIGLIWSFFIDTRYLHADVYYLRAQRDSMTAIQTTRELQHYFDSTTRDLKACIRHPGDCK